MGRRLGQRGLLISVLLLVAQREEDLPNLGPRFATPAPAAPDAGALAFLEVPSTLVPDTEGQLSFAAADSARILWVARREVFRRCSDKDFKAKDDQK